MCVCFFVCLFIFVFPYCVEHIREILNSKQLLLLPAVLYMCTCVFGCGTFAKFLMNLFLTFGNSESPNSFWAFCHAFRELVSGDKRELLYHESAMAIALNICMLIAVFPS